MPHRATVFLWWFSPERKSQLQFLWKKEKNISQDWFCLQYFRGKKIHTDWDLRVEQAEFKELTVINFILLYMNIVLKCFLCVTTKHLWDDQGDIDDDQGDYDDVDNDDGDEDLDNDDDGNGDLDNDDGGKDLDNDHHCEIKVIANSEAGVTVCLPAARGGKLKYLFFVICICHFYFYNLYLSFLSPQML